MKQIVDEPHEVIHLPLHHRVELFDRRGVAADAKQVKGVSQRRERVAQLVREHRDELVLALVDLSQRGFRGRALGDLVALSAGVADEVFPFDAPAS